MAEHAVVNLVELEDQAAGFGMPDGFEARFVSELGLEQTGMAYFRVAPGVRTAFGHRHAPGEEEVYVVLSGTARIKIEDDIVDLKAMDAIRVPGEAMRCFEAGPEGAEVLATGVKSDRSAAELVPGWWKG